MDELDSLTKKTGMKPLLYYMARVHTALFNEPNFSSEWVKKVERDVKPGILKKWLASLFIDAVKPAESKAELLKQTVARNLLYIRGHYVKMPLRLLIPHLLRKAIRRKLFLER